MSAETPSTARPRTLQNALATLVGRGSGVLFKFAVIAELARFLSPADYFTYGVLASTLDVARVMTNFGLDTATIRRMALQPTMGGALLSLVLRLKTFFALIGFLVVAALAFVRPTAGAAPWLALVLGATLFPVTWTASLTARFQAEHAAHWLIPVQVTSGTLYLVLIWLVAHSGGQLTWFVSLIFVAELITFALLAIAARTRWRAEARATNPLPARPFLREALPLGLYDMAVVIYARLGVFLLEAQGESMKADGGQLYFAMKINEVTVAIAGALAISALPVFSRHAHAGESQQIRRSFLRYSLSGAAFSIGVATFLTLFGGVLLRTFRPAYAPAAVPLAVFAWAGVAMFQNNISISVLNAFGRFRTASACAFLNLIVYSISAVVLIPRLGALGAAASTLVTEGINMLVQLTFVAPLLARKAAASPTETSVSLPESG